jgi:hypothetical protein
MPSRSTQKATSSSDNSDDQATARHNQTLGMRPARRSARSRDDSRDTNASRRVPSRRAPEWLARRRPESRDAAASRSSLKELLSRDLGCLDPLLDGRTTSATTSANTQAAAGTTLPDRRQRRYRRPTDALLLLLVLCTRVAVVDRRVGNGTQDTPTFAIERRLSQGVSLCAYCSRALWTLRLAAAAALKRRDRVDQ